MKFNYLSICVCIVAFLGCKSNSKYPIIDPLKDTVHHMTSMADSNLVTSGTVNTAALKNIYETISQSADHTLFIAAIQSAGLDKELSGNNQYTLLAPTDEAFKKLSRSVYNNILKPSNHQKTKDLVSSQILKGTLRQNDMKDGLTLKTLNGRKLLVSNKDGNISINGIPVRYPGLNCKNGVIITTDMVLQ